MIAKVMQIIEKPTTKGNTYLNVTLSVDGKKVVVNSFDTADHITFQQAFEKGFFLNVEVEKNEKGYDNLKSVKFVADQVPPAVIPVIPKADLTPKTSDNIKTPPPDNFKINQFNQEDAKIRSMALSYAKDLAVVKVIDVTGIIIAANQFYTYITSGKITTE
jgi:hypothetical protein